MKLQDMTIREAKKLSKERLLQLMASYKSCYMGIVKRLDEYKVMILYLQRKTRLLEMKLEFLENKRGSRPNYRNIGKRHNKDIGTMRRRDKKSKEQEKCKKSKNC